MSLHERNPHRGKYDFVLLVQSLPELEKYIILNPSGEKTINFSDADAVLLLNKAILKYFYHVDHWLIPEGYLCPPIPGRADYIHYAADLLAEMNVVQIPTGKRVTILDIGTGANCVYPIVGSQSYGWKFTATEIDPLSLKTARLIVQSNKSLSKNIAIRQQKQKQFIFRNIIGKGDRFDLTMCNPPFHSSRREAQEANLRKWKNLGHLKGSETPNFNFGGSENELWCPGGELAFIQKMMKESRDFSSQVLWFTTLVSQKDNVPLLRKFSEQQKVSQFQIIPMKQGQKISRIIAWSFFSTEASEAWAQKYWN
jgi:23S rRNA (adenine1618-N6)-methyltransferase